MKKIKFLSLGVLVLLFFGCSASVKHYLQYDIVLEGVERPSEENEQFREQTVSTTEEYGYTYMFEDEMIKILWLPLPTELRFLLENKTNDSIKIIWNEASYVCEKGESHRVLHTDVKVIDRFDLQVASVVEQKGVLEDFVYPADYVSYSHDSWAERPYMGAGWTERSLLPHSQKGGDPQEFLNKAKSYIGKEVHVSLPIKLDDVVNKYLFIFKVKDVNLVEK